MEKETKSVMPESEYDKSVNDNTNEIEIGKGYVSGRVYNEDGITGVSKLYDNSIHLILSDIPYGISIDEWDVLHNNKNSALLGESPAQKKAGAIFKRRGKPLNGWSEEDRKISKEYQDWCSSFAKEWQRVLKPGGSAFVFAGRRLSHRCIVAFEDAGFTFKDSLVWKKQCAPHRAQRLSSVFERRKDGKNAEKCKGWKIGNLRPIFEPVCWFVKPYPVGSTIADNFVKNGLGAFNEECFLKYEENPNNILTTSFSSKEKGLHIAQKPLKTMQSLIELVTHEGHIVLDPFAGSGSTLLAAKNTNRRFIGFELSEIHANEAQARIMTQKNKNI